MRYNITINNVKAKEFNLNIQQAYLFAWMYELPSWANKVIIEGDIFYFASKTKAIEELPLLTDKPDTMYRYYKQLETLGLISIKKIDAKDYISLTAKAKEWNEYKSDYSENNPTQLGKISESNSDLNPTYNNTNINNTISNNIYISKPLKFDFKKSLIEYGFNENLVDDWLLIRKNKKATNTQTAFNNFIKEIEKTKKNINEVLEIIVDASWSGFKAHYLENKTNLGFNQNKPLEQPKTFTQKMMEGFKK